MKHTLKITFLNMTLSLALMSSASAVNFQSCVNSLKSGAKSAGIPSNIINSAFAIAKPKPDVVKKSKNQPEFVKPVWEYIDNAVSPYRLKIGKSKLQEHKDLFTALEVLYGVNRHVLTAIWGMETSFGAFQGKRNTIESLITLACYNPSREKYAKQQLNAALKILARGDITLNAMEGSWAGAMGQTQFIPTTYEAYAVDVDGDFKRDIWNSKADALGSAANYLRARGWKPELPWGYEVKLPANFDFSLNNRDQYHQGSFWHQKGVRLMNGRAIPYQDYDLALVAPAGADGPAFILTTNFKSILAYNRSTAYALSIGHLSDRLAGHSPFIAQWPTHNTPLTFSERKALQLGLKNKGFYNGSIDGMIGSGSIEAIKSFQRHHGLVADGYPGKELLEKIQR